MLKWDNNRSGRTRGQTRYQGFGKNSHSQDPGNKNSQSFDPSKRVNNNTSSVRGVHRVVVSKDLSKDTSNIEKARAGRQKKSTVQTRGQDSIKGSKPRDCDSLVSGSNRTSQRCATKRSESLHADFTVCKREAGTLGPRRVTGARGRGSRPCKESVREVKTPAKRGVSHDSALRPDGGNHWKKHGSCKKARRGRVVREEAETVPSAMRVLRIYGSRRFKITKEPSAYVTQATSSSHVSQVERTKSSTNSTGQQASRQRLLFKPYYDEIARAATCKSNALCHAPGGGQVATPFVLPKTIDSDQRRTKPRKESWNSRYIVPTRQKKAQSVYGHNLPKTSKAPGKNEHKVLKSNDTTSKERNNALRSQKTRWDERFHLLDHSESDTTTRRARRHVVKAARNVDMDEYVNRLTGKATNTVQSRPVRSGVDAVRPVRGEVGGVTGVRRFQHVTNQPIKQKKLPKSMSYWEAIHSINKKGSRKLFHANGSGNSRNITNEPRDVQGTSRNLTNNMKGTRTSDDKPAHASLMSKTETHCETESDPVIDSFKLSGAQGLTAYTELPLEAIYLQDVLDNLLKKQRFKLESIPARADHDLPELKHMRHRRGKFSYVARLTSEESKQLPIDQSDVPPEEPHDVPYMPTRMRYSRPSTPRYEQGETRDLKDEKPDISALRDVHVHQASCDVTQNMKQDRGSPVMWEETNMVVTSQQDDFNTNSRDGTSEYDEDEVGQDEESTAESSISGGSRRSGSSPTESVDLGDLGDAESSEDMEDKGVHPQGELPRHDGINSEVVPATGQGGTGEEEEVRDTGGEDEEVRVPDVEEDERVRGLVLQLVKRVVEKNKMKWKQGSAGSGSERAAPSRSKRSSQAPGGRSGAMRPISGTELCWVTSPDTPRAAEPTKRRQSKTTFSQIQLAGYPPRPPAYKSGSTSQTSGEDLYGAVSADATASQPEMLLNQRPTPPRGTPRPAPTLLSSPLPPLLPMIRPRSKLQLRSGTSGSQLDDSCSQLPVDSDRRDSDCDQHQLVLRLSTFLAASSFDKLANMQTTRVRTRPSGDKARFARDHVSLRKFALLREENMRAREKLLAKVVYQRMRAERMLEEDTTRSTETEKSEEKHREDDEAETRSCDDLVEVDDTDDSRSDEDEVIARSADIQDREEALLGAHEAPPAAQEVRDLDLEVADLMGEMEELEAARNRKWSVDLEQGSCSHICRLGEERSGSVDIDTRDHMLTWERTVTSVDGGEDEASDAARDDEVGGSSDDASITDSVLADMSAESGAGSTSDDTW